jgi:CRP/FNR family transcriptional regulator, cyclic AMP receptor protein
LTPSSRRFLGRSLVGKQELSFQKGQKIFSQGDQADSIYFIQAGRIKISVVSVAGKEAVLAMPGPHEFFGEGALVNQSLRISGAGIINCMPCGEAIHDPIAPRTAGASEKFMAALLTRNIDLEEDLCDQLFNHSEKRLARVLLKLARLQGHDISPDATVPVLSHETLAEMVGTTRSRITHFMNKFRKMGLIDYNGHLIVRTELLTDLVSVDPCDEFSCDEDARALPHFWLLWFPA